MWYHVTTARASLGDFSRARAEPPPVRDFAISENHCFGFLITKFNENDLLSNHDTNQALLAFASKRVFP
jgi:hypothetical protein